MSLVNEHTGEEIPTAVALDRLIETQKRCGRIILGSEVPVEIGEIQYFGGLPFRVVQLSSYEEAMKDADLTADLWGEMPFGVGDEYYFQVEVAD